MNVHGVGHSAAAGRVQPHARTESTPTEAPAATTSSSETTAPTTPLVPDESPTADDVSTQQQDAGVAGPRGLVRKGVVDANGDGRIDGRDVAFAKHGIDHPGRGFTPEHVGGTVVLDAPDPQPEDVTPTVTDPVDVPTEEPVPDEDPTRDPAI